MPFAWAIFSTYPPTLKATSTMEVGSMLAEYRMAERLLKLSMARALTAVSDFVPILGSLWHPFPNWHNKTRANQHLMEQPSSVINVRDSR
jgi:hypothetical protein